ncbi:MAG: AAA family ATPase [Bacteroidales bacterium]|jgi:dephospho-CoA kinase|nr:AAA family ATPase [Bacteroidales bacterium]
MIIVGITGTLGSGKGTIVDFLKEKGFSHFSARDFIVKTIEKENLIVDRDSMTLIANRLREENSPSYIIEQLYNEALKGKNNSIIESIRNPKEVNFLKEKDNFILIGVDADIHKRYERILKRKSQTDSVSFETFKQNEEREMHSNDINAQNIAFCMQKADILIDNSGTIDQLKEKVDILWKNIIQKK